MGKSLKDMELIKKNNKKKIKRITSINGSINENQSGLDTEWLCESEKEFDNINEIEDSETVGMKIIIIHTIKEK